MMKEYESGIPIPEQYIEKVHEMIIAKRKEKKKNIYSLD